VEELSVSYGDFVAVDRVSLHIQQGEMVCMIGANGAGKTSLIRAVSGIVPAAGGKVWWKGLDISRMPSWEICELGIIQVAEGRQIFPSLSVSENLNIGGALRRSRERRALNLDRVFERFHRLKERRHQRAGTLSGGEQQMLAIGRAMMAEPELIMLDEPSIGLSPALTDQMFKVAEELRRDGATVLLVEQNVARSLAISQRGYVIENGRVALEDDAAILLTNPDIRKAYLGL
jgi:branched-chain amino acid transport system ATP-binding protein